MITHISKYKNLNDLISDMDKHGYKKIKTYDLPLDIDHLERFDESIDDEWEFFVSIEDITNFELFKTKFNKNIFYNFENKRTDVFLDNIFTETLYTSYILKHHDPEPGTMTLYKLSNDKENVLQIYAKLLK
jgi:hypothetical protein